MNHLHPAPTTFWRKYIFATDHKVIGMQYLLTGIFMALVGGFLSYVFRMQLAFPGISIPFYGKLTANEYNSFITMHGTIMIFWVAMPILLAAFGNLLIPLMVGTDDMAFPTLNMMSYWVFFISTVILLASFFVPGGTFAGGWTAYPPLSANEGYSVRPSFTSGLGGHFWIIAVALEFVAFLMGGINFLVTSFNMRAPGLTWFRLPLVVWMIDIAVLLFMFAVGPLLAGAVMLFFDRAVGTGFYNPIAGGDPLLFQHLFCFVVWAHHQFVSGINPKMAVFFSITTILISIPFAVIIFASIATLWKGSIVLKTPMLFALGFIGEFLIGGVTGIYLGSSAFDIYAHGTYFVIAHFHYALIPTVVYGGFAGVYFWYPKFMGRMPNETLGKLHFWGTTIFFNMIFLPLFFGGMMGEHRRIYDYSVWPNLMHPTLVMYRQIATFGVVGILLSQVPFFVNMIMSYRRGAYATKNPWNANTLDWTTASPPPHGNFETTPTVYRGAYEFNTPGREKDYWPQNV
ncbi:MAG: cbb3-type cytochrome c oxidase subunit I, partial [Spirochaetia bacterium]|nr:cbb3-type cytochrome c oxidase subunit I [Spirochaetia bacterium]